jgi:hypothetical protein
MGAAAPAEDAEPPAADAGVDAPVELYRPSFSRPSVSH